MSLLLCRTLLRGREETADVFNLACSGIPKNAFDWDHILLPAHFAVWLASGEADFLHGRFLWAHWDVDEMIEKFPARIEKEPQFLKFGLTA